MKKSGENEKTLEGSLKGRLSKNSKDKVQCSLRDCG